jgi:hypothetical protein
MTTEERAREFVAGAFGPFGVDQEPYVKIIKELLDGAVDDERKRCVRLALEQRCERGTPWDKACVTIAEVLRSANQ